LAANLGLRSIAEGVETQDQLDHLRALGCDQAQGYLFAKPLSPKDVPSVINAAW
jgi:EAL domain-containing protein (putative c-di-GMP-specific phosphodiesterase class I)